jgi:hypothetical protein
MYINSTREVLPHHPSFKSLLLQKKIFGSLQRPIAQGKFRIQITWQIRNRILKKFSKVYKGPDGVDLRIKPEDKNLTLLCL